MNKRIIGLLVIALLVAVALVAFPSRVFSPELTSRPQAPQPASKQPSEPEFDKKKYSLNDPNSIWVIASKVQPLQPVEYAPSDLTDVGGGQQLRTEAAKAFTKLLADARSENVEIIPLSGYRSYQTQQAVYASEVQRYGQAAADAQSARPGHSEHQTGLGIDVGGGGCGIEDCFGGTEPYKWLQKNAHKYGYIQRYTPDKQAITGYRAEPWHWRYVGKDLATEMHTKHIETLEEFFDVVPASQPW